MFKMICLVFLYISHDVFEQFAQVIKLLGDYETEITEENKEEVILG